MVQDLENEVWKPIKEWEGIYEISNYGRIKSLPRLVIKKNGWDSVLKEKIIAGVKIPKDNVYISCTLRFNNKLKEIRMHTLVASHFLEKDSTKKFVNHIDGNKRNNHVSNLEWVNSHENNAHMVLLKKKTSMYVGVNKVNAIKRKWQSRIMLNGVRTVLGYFETEIEAHNAYISKMKELGIDNKYAIRNPVNE